MLTPIITEGLFIVLFWWVTGPHNDYSLPNDRVDIAFGVFAFCTFSAIAIAAGVGIAFGLGSINATESNMDSRPYKSVDLVSLRSSDGVSGAMYGGIFLMTGYIGSQQYYYWYEQAGDALTPRQVQAGKGVYVYEEDRKGGHLDVFKWHANDRWRWLIPFSFRNDDDFGKTWNFHVPKGSVQRQFQLK